MTEREAADRLNLMPGYVAILEKDDYQALRSPAFARGYVKAYGKLLQLDETRLLSLYDKLAEANQDGGQKRVETRPLQLQQTGVGVVIGLTVLALLVLGLWWWQGESAQRTAPPQSEADVQLPVVPQSAITGEP